MNFIRRWLAARQAKRFRKWAQENRVIFNKPLPWPGQTKRREVNDYRR